MMALRRFILLIVCCVALGASSRAMAAPDILSTLFHSHGAIMLLIDPADGRILDANPAAQIFYGYKDLRSMRIQDINVLGPAEVAAERARAQADARNYFVFPHRLASGEIRTVEVYSWTVPYQGDRLALFSIIHDISGRQLAEDQLVEYRARLEELVIRRTDEVLEGRTWIMTLLGGGLIVTVALNLALFHNIRRKRAALDALSYEASKRAQAQESLGRAHDELHRFAEITAHHLQEPARRLSIFAQRLSRRLDKVLTDDEDRQALSFMDQQARRLQALLRDVQLYLATGLERGETLSHDPDRIFRDVVRKASQSPGAPIVAAIIGAIPPLAVDEVRLKDIAGILVENALHYAASDGKVDLSISAETLGNFVRLKVADRGPGIAPEFRVRVFQVFERLAADGEGTGIGLAVVRRIVESCGGRTWVEETPGGGCTVIIELPKAVED